MKVTKKDARKLVERKIIQGLILKKSANKIAAEFRTCKKTIKKLKVLAEQAGYFDGREIPPFPEPLFAEDEKSFPISEPDMQMLPHVEWMNERIDLGWHKITIWEELPIRVTRASFFRFINRHGIGKAASKKRVVPEIIHEPGEALILDWGKLCDFIDSSGKKKTAWAFIGVMGFSRWMSVRIVLTNSTNETLSALESILQELGGVPSRVTSDNPKCFAIEANRFEPVLNIGIERFASHYGFIMECLPPADPQKKGKVERLVPFVRRIFEAHGEWKGLEEAQEYLNRKVCIANQRKHGTTRLCPVEQLDAIERKTLKELPAIAFAREEYHSTIVRKDGHIRFKGKYYSLDENYIGKEIFIIATYERINIYFQNKLIETHARLYSGNTSKSTKTHHRKPAERVMDDNDHYIKRAEKIGQNTKEVVMRILLQGNGFVDTRKIWGILGLDKAHAAHELDDACLFALQQDDLKYRTIKGYLDARKKDPVRDVTDQQSYRFIRDVNEYETLLSRLNLKEEKICQ